MAVIKRRKPKRWGRVVIFLKISVAVVFIGSIYIFFHANENLEISNNNKPSANSISKSDRSPVQTKKSKNASYVTVVMPSVVNPKDQAKRLKAIAHTWGPAARAVYIVHDDSEFSSFPTLSDSSLSEPPTTFPVILRIPPSIPEDQGVQRLQYVIRTVSNVFSSSEFAFFVNDHTYVIPEKVCSFVTKLDSSQQIYAGHALKDLNMDYAFNSGAAGYILSHTTIKSLLKKFDDKDPLCIPPPDNKWLNGNPGLVTAQCLHKALNVFTMDTRQSSALEINDFGGHIFHAYGIVRTATADVDEWYRNKHKGFDSLSISTEAVRSTFNPGYEKSIVDGEVCCSSDTISFHYVESYETLALFAIRKEIYEKQLEHRISNENLKKMIQQKWPDNDTKGWIGGYAKPLPKDIDQEKWSLLLSAFRKILNYNSDCM